MLYCRAVKRTEPPAPNFLLRWSLQALVAGVFGALIVQSFSRLLNAMTTRLGAEPLTSLIGAVIGAFLVGLVVYRIAPGAAGEGIPAYLQSLRTEGATLSLKDTVLKYPAALLTLGLFGSGGLVGPVGRVAAGTSQGFTLLFQRLLPDLFADHEHHHAQYHAPTTAAICGMAAAVAAIFGAPVAGAVFAVEVIQTDQLRYQHIFPASMAAGTAVFMSRLFGWSPLFLFRVPAFEAELLIFLPVVFVGFASGGMSVVYTSFYQMMARKFRRHQIRPPLSSLVLGMVGASVLGILVSPSLNGVSRPLFDALATGDLASLSIAAIPSVEWTIPILVIIIAGKMVGNVITTGSGMSAGFTGPAVITGMAGGALIAEIIGVAAGTPGYYTLLASGLSGMLAGMINTPLAGAILVVELFGAGYGVPAAISTMLAFQVARSSTIYETALKERSLRR
jgi:CIC family chloride channel protein